MKTSRRRVAVTLLAIAALAIGLVTACSTANVHRAREQRRYLGDHLYVERYGSGSPVVFLPGLMGSTRFWAGAHFDALAGKRSLIFVDELGFGRSPWPDGEYTLDEHLAALRQTLVREGATHDVTIVAHSFGTILAAYYAARHPGEVRHLYLLGTPMFRSPEEARKRMRAMSPLAALFARSRLLAMSACMLQDALQPLAARLAPRLAGGVPAAVAHDATLHYWTSLDGSIRNVILSRPIEEALATVGSRTTFIHGDVDPVTSAQRVREVAAATGGRAVIVHGDHGDYVGEATELVKRELQ